LQTTTEEGRRDRRRESGRKRAGTWPIGATSTRRSPWLAALVQEGRAPPMRRGI